MSGVTWGGSADIAANIFHWLVAIGTEQPHEIDLTVIEGACDLAGLPRSAAPGALAEARFLYWEHVHANRRTGLLARYMSRQWSRAALLARARELGVCGVKATQTKDCLAHSLGTVKKLDRRDDEAQTILTRCKIVK